MADFLLRAADVNYSYPGRGRAISNINASFSTGLTLLVGANASGKSTLLRLLSGLVATESGAFVDENGSALTGETLWKMSRLVIQDADPQILGATVAEDVNLGKATSNLNNRFDSECQRLLARFGLKGNWAAPVETLSFGQKRKLNLMNAMLAGPKLLLLDEPFEGLDYPSSRELREFIAENRAAGIGQIISTHDLEPVIALADWLVVMRQGDSAVEGRPYELLPNLDKWSVRPPGRGWTIDKEEK
jgi:ABC-type cobalt transport system, ATPase component